MRLPKAVRDNLYFQVAEVQAQILNLKVLMETSAPTVAQRILDRRGYVYNLKMRIHDRCVKALRNGAKDAPDVSSLRAAEAIASDLEWVGELCHECVRHHRDAKYSTATAKSGVVQMLDQVISGLEMISATLEEEGVNSTLKIGDIETKLDKQYQSLFVDHIRKLRKRRNTTDYIYTLFIAERVEEMGDALLTISEAIMSARLGHPMNTDRFLSLQSAMSDLGLENAEFEPIAETKSGSGISGISDGGKDDGFLAIFKDGRKDKLKEERESVESWHDVYPGLAPQILSYKKQGKNASLLIEHLPGVTFDRLIVQEKQDHLDAGLRRLKRTVRSVWKETQKKKSVGACHMDQLRKRLSDVAEIHPDFEWGRSRINDQEITGLHSLISKAAEREREVAAPFSVYIHGDFNLDNIIYDRDLDSIRFIDLHRSAYQDYTQDVSVFMVSNYRLQVLDAETRRRISHVALEFYEFAKSFAEKNDDDMFEFRLALGLARSFITSTRFILDRKLANAMVLRGRFILEEIVGAKKKNLTSFGLPMKELLS